MSTCLVALGSNLGDRQVTLDAAVAEIDAIPCVAVRRHSRWYATRPIGTESDREFLNGAVLCDSSLDPLELLTALQRIEALHGRQRTERWADRMLDLDLLLHDNLVLETPILGLTRQLRTRRGQVVRAPTVPAL